MIANITRGSNFTGVLRYVMGKPHAELMMTNVASGYGELTDLAKAFRVTAATNPRVKKPVYHLSISPAQRDTLSTTQWLTLIKDLLKQRHLAEHQYVAVLHKDATYPDGSMRPHVHLVINLVGSTGEVANVWWDYPKTEKILRHLEKCYGLTSVPCSWEVAKRSNSKGQVQRLARETAEFLTVDHPRTQQPQPNVRQLLQQAVDEAVVDSTSTAELTKALQSRGVVSTPTSQGIQYELNGIHFAGYQLGESYTLKAIEQQLRLQQKRKAQQQWEQKLSLEPSPSLSSQASLPQSLLAQRDEYEKRMSQLQQHINFVASRVAYSLITANTTQDSISTRNATYTMTWDDATKELRLYCTQPDLGERLFPILFAEYDSCYQKWIGKGVVSHYLNQSHLTDWASFVTTPELLNLPNNYSSHPIIKAMESSLITTNQMTTNQTEQVLPLSSSQLPVQPFPRTHKKPNLLEPEL